MTAETSLWRPARPADAPARPRTKAGKLAAAAQSAADVRAYDTNPDVIAYRIERMRTRVDRLIWTGLILGLAFTAANVQAFAAHGTQKFDIGWWIAWLLDPMVSLVLIGVLLGEQVIARHGITAGAWVHRTKWCALGLTYAMNTWSAWEALNPAAILLHSVPPLIVFCAAEAVTTLRHQITEAVHKAYGMAVGQAADAEAARVRTQESSRTEQSRPAIASTASLRTEAAEIAPVRTEPVRTQEAAPRTEITPVRTEPARTEETTFRTEAVRTEAVRTEAAAPVRTAPARTEELPRTEAAAPVRTEPAPASRTASRPVRPAAPAAPAAAEAEREPMAKTDAVAQLRAMFLEAIERGESKWSPPYDQLVGPSGRSRSWWEKAWKEARDGVIPSVSPAVEPVAPVAEAIAEAVEPPRTQEAAPRSEPLGTEAAEARTEEPGTEPASVRAYGDLIRTEPASVRPDAEADRTEAESARTEEPSAEEESRTDDGDEPRTEAEPARTDDVDDLARAETGDADARTETGTVAVFGTEATTRSLSDERVRTEVAA